MRPSTMSKLRRRRVLRARRRRRGELLLVDGRLPMRKLSRVQVAAAKELGRRRLTKMLQRPRPAPTNSPSQLQSFITMATSASSDFVKLTSAFATSVVVVATSAWNFISSTAPVPREVRRRVTSRRCRRRTRALLHSTAVRKPDDCLFAALAVAAQRAKDESLLAVLRKPAGVRATRLGQLPAAYLRARRRRTALKTSLSCSWPSTRPTKSRLWNASLETRHQRYQVIEGSMDRLLSRPGQDVRRHRPPYFSVGRDSTRGRGSYASSRRRQTSEHARCADRGRCFADDRRRNRGPCRPRADADGAGHRHYQELGRLIGGI